LRFNGEEWPSYQVPLGCELQLDMTKWPRELRDKLEYRWIVAAKNVNPSSRPAPDYASVLPPLPLDRPGHLDVTVGLRDRTTGAERAFWLGGVDARDQKP
jgi:hypothetical protein